VSWKGLRHKGTERLTSREWNTVIDALDELHSALTDGTRDINVNKVTAKTGEFLETLTVQGKAVLKDGDPIHIASFFEQAKNQITQAIDASKVSDISAKQDTAIDRLTSIRDTLSRISIDDAGNLSAKIVELSPSAIGHVAQAIDSSKVSEVSSKQDVVIDRLTSIRDRLSQISIDELGNLSAKITSPLDQDGNVKVSIPKARFDAEGNLYVAISKSEIAIPVDIRSRYKSGFTVFEGTVTSSGNTSEIPVEPFSVVEILVKVTGVSGVTPALSVYIEGKFDATGDWKVLASQEDITTTGVWFLTINPLVFRAIRARWTVSGIAPSFTLVIAAQAMV